MSASSPSATAPASGKSIGHELLTWLCFTVLLALLPLVLNFLWGRLQSHTPGLADLLKRGELFLVSTALTAESLGRLFNIGHPKKRLQRILCAVAGLYVLIWGSVEFAMLMTKLESISSAGTPAVYNVSAVVTDSIAVLVLSVFVGFSAIMLSEG